MFDVRFFFFQYLLLLIVLGDFLYQVLTSEKVDYIFSKSKLLIKTLFQIKG